MLWGIHTWSWRARGLPTLSFSPLDHPEPGLFYLHLFHSSITTLRSFLASRILSPAWIGDNQRYPPVLPAAPVQKEVPAKLSTLSLFPLPLGFPAPNRLHAVVVVDRTFYTLYLNIDCYIRLHSPTWTTGFGFGRSLGQCQPSLRILSHKARKDLSRPWRATTWRIGQQRDRRTCSVLRILSHKARKDFSRPLTATTWWRGQHRVKKTWSVPICRARKDFCSRSWRATTWRRGQLRARRTWSVPRILSLKARKDLSRSRRATSWRRGQPRAQRTQSVPRILSLNTRRDLLRPWRATT